MTIDVILSKSRDNCYLKCNHNLSKKKCKAFDGTPQMAKCKVLVGTEWVLFNLFPLMNSISALLKENDHNPVQSKNKTTQNSKGNKRNSPMN